MSEPSFAFAATPEKFPQLALGSSCKGRVLVDFWASWAGPSLRQRVLLLRLAGEYAGHFLLITVDTDRQKSIAEGAVAEPENPSLPLMLAKLLIQDERHGGTQAVLAALPSALEAHPPIQRLADHLSLILAPRRAPPVAELEAALAGDPADSDARLALAVVHLTNDDDDGALAGLAELVRSDPEYGEGIPRRALGAVLDLLDPADERVRRYRCTLFGY